MAVISTIARLVRIAARTARPAFQLHARVPERICRISCRARHMLATKRTAADARKTCDHVSGDSKRLDRSASGSSAPRRLRTIARAMGWARLVPALMRTAAPRPRLGASATAVSAPHRLPVCSSTSSLLSHSASSLTLQPRSYSGSSRSHQGPRSGTLISSGFGRIRAAIYVPMSSALALTRELPYHPRKREGLTRMRPHCCSCGRASSEERPGCSITSVRCMPNGSKTCSRMYRGNGTPDMRWTMAARST